MMKYNEDNILKDIKDYIEGTYNQHYAGDTYQFLDMLSDIGVKKGMLQASAMKYLYRLGKKGDEADARIDLYKAVHYIVLLLDEYTLDKDIHTK